MLHVYQSNRLERLAAELGKVLADPLPSPFAAEDIVVQGVGVARWLSLHLAREFGICANVHYPLPGRFIWGCFRAFLPGVRETSEFEPEVLTWRIFKTLGHLDGSPNWGPLRAYLEARDARSAYQLASQLAAVYDQYLVYRPEWIRAWEAGKETHWQAEFWRSLIRSSEGRHWAHVQDAFLEALGKGQIDWRPLPARVSLFGISSLSPAFLDILAKLATKLDVHLFLLNPCRQYWGDIVTEKERSRKSERAQAAAYFETGHPLLASWGKPMRDFIDMVLGYPAVDHEAFEAVVATTLLGRLQADILDLIDRGSPEHPPAQMPSGDRSIQVHACHSPMRELEVLHDQLLRLFEECPGLESSDILVMTPDIAAYAPFVEAVFGSMEGPLRIPYGIAGDGASGESPLIEAFLRLFHLPQGRFEAEQVMAVVECPAVLHRFHLGEEEVPRLRQWIREAGIRWGVDGSHRGQLGLPADQAHSWRAGLDRLLLGYALPGDDARLFSGILPYEAAEGSDAQVFGRFISLCETLFALRDELREERPIARWVEALSHSLNRLFAPQDDEEADLARIRELLNDWGRTADIAGFDGPIPLEVVQTYLEEVLGSSGVGWRFLSGGVSFTALTPLSGLPFRVVCLIGMNDGAFPRMARKLGFDLMANDFRRGDRSRRDDDRSLFLEALLSARDCLFISYVGQDIRDNSELPPSVLVSELLDHLNRGFVGGDGRPPQEEILVRHPLQAFSRRYFTGDERLFSYFQARCEAVRKASAGKTAAKPLLTQPLPEAEAEWRTLSLDDLIRFFGHPTRYLLQERLGLYLEPGEEALPGHEPFTLEGLERWRSQQQLLDIRLKRGMVEEAFPLFRAAGLLPHGRIGEVSFETQRDAVESFAARLGGHWPAEFIEPLEIDLALGEMGLTGRLGGLTPLGLVGYRLGKVSARDLLALWIRHLVLNAIVPAGVEPMSLWIGEDKTLRLAPLEGASNLLRGLLELYWLGLRRPLPFFPKSSLAYARAAAKGHDQPLGAARKEWLGGEFSPGECQDPYHDLCCRGQDPLDEEFSQLAQAVFGPLLSAMQEA